MDPNACLARILAAVSVTSRTLSRDEMDDLRREFAEACADLADWLRRGGFKPTLPADMRWIPGTGTRWKVLSPNYDTDGHWVLRHYDYRGETQESFVLD
jgi:hypothetical protein